MALVKMIPHPVLGLLAALFSHFVVDMLPHWNWHPSIKPLSLLGMTLDLILAQILTFYIFFGYGEGNFLLPLGAFLGILPDLLEAPTVLLGWRIRGVDKLMRLQSRLQTNTELLPGILSQILLSFLCLWLLTR